MQIVDNLFQKHRDKTLLGILIVVSLTLLNLPQPAKMGMVKYALNALFLPVDRATHFIEGYVGVKDENRRLRRMVASLTLERERLLQFKDERERLRRLAAFKEEQFYNLVPCEVVGRNLDRFQTVLVIDKGSKDGLEPRMPVLSYQGYVGQVLQVFEDSAWIKLVSSKNSPVSCIDKRSRVVGILEWRHHDYFDLTSVSVVEDVRAGDTLLTSGFGGVVPKGFTVAVVTKVMPAADGLSLKVDARSRINFRSLEAVFVMTDEIPWDRGIFYDQADSALMRNIMKTSP